VRIAGLNDHPVAAMECELGRRIEPRRSRRIFRVGVPAPTPSRVLITLVRARDDIDPDVALVRVRELADELREEVAAEVTRKRVPELVFWIERAVEQH
jgi:hypothetical protein